MIKLKHCPCCAGAAGVEGVEGRYRVYCFGCGLNTILHDDVSRAAHAWNRRKEPASATSEPEQAPGTWKTQAQMNRDRSTELLVSRGVKFESHNHGYHLVVEAAHGKIDFWPSTGRWLGRAQGAGRGVKNLLMHLGQAQVAATRKDASCGHTDQ